MAHFDPARNLWIDDTNPNVIYLNSVWVNQQDGTYMDATGTWQHGVPNGPVDYSQMATTQQQQGTAPATNTTAPSKPVPGYGYDIMDINNAQETSINNADNETLLKQQQMIADSQANVARIQSELNLEIAKGNNASQERIAALEHELGTEQNRIALMNATTQQAAEARQERLLQSQLAANPQDTVAYEFYKRALGQPGVYQQGQQGAPSTGIQATGGAATGSGGGGVATASSATSQYPAAPPAYSDESLQGLASELFGNAGAPWNPRLSGEGVFGSQIASPNSQSRWNVGRMSEGEMGILNSFLKAGINMGGGQRVSIDPNDYWRQSQNSWVPTFNDAGAMTNYR